MKCSCPKCHVEIQKAGFCSSCVMDMDCAPEPQDPPVNAEKLAGYFGVLLALAAFVATVGSHWFEASLCWCGGFIMIQIGAIMHSRKCKGSM